MEPAGFFFSDSNNISFATVDFVSITVFLITFLQELGITALVKNEKDATL